MSDKILKATHTGALKIADYEISCAVLEDGTRVLVDRSLANVFRRKGSGHYWKKKKEGVGNILPEYVSANYLQPYMSDELKRKLFNPIKYTDKNETQIRIGVEATVLPDICDLWIKVKDEGALDEKQEITASIAYVLLRGFANIGITALIDEATGYQYDRDHDALHKILEAYINKEFLPWTKRFPDEFYKQLFRLKGWSYSPLTVKRPRIIGKITNQIIYKQLPPGVLDELKKKTPKSESGNYTKRFHQSLSPDIGNPHLEKHLSSVITLMRISPDWRTFKRHFARAFGQQQELPLLMDDDIDM